MMPDGLKAHIRTYWPLVLGQITTMLLAWIWSRYGVEIDSTTAYALVSAVVTGLVYSLGYWLQGRRWAPARGLGSFILSLGLVAEKPTYLPELPPGTVRPLGRR